MAKAQSTTRRRHREHGDRRDVRAYWRVALAIGFAALLAACATGRGEGDLLAGDAAADGTGAGSPGEIVSRDLATRARDELAVLSQPAGIATIDSATVDSATVDGARVDGAASRGGASREANDASVPVPVNAPNGAAVADAGSTVAQDEPVLIPDDAPGAPIIARTWPSPPATAGASAASPVDPPGAQSEAPAQAPPAVQPGFVGRVLQWFSSEGSVVAGEPVPVVGIVPPPAPSSGSDIASANQAVADAGATRIDGAAEPPTASASAAGVVRGIPPWPAPQAPASPAPVASASATHSLPAPAFDMAAVEGGGFAAILGAMHGMVERCGDDNRIREDALKAFRLAYPSLDLARRDVEAGPARERADGQFERQAASLKANERVNCDYVRLQTIAWSELATDLRRMSSESAVQYRPGLITEVQRGAGVGGF